MKSIREAEGELNSVNGELTKLERNLRDLRRTRPTPALAAARGDGAALAKLDGQIKGLEDRRMVLQDGILAAKHQLRCAKQQEVRKYVEAYLEAIGRVKPALSHLVNSVGVCNDTLTRLTESVHTTGAKFAFPGSPNPGILAAVAAALGIKILEPQLSDVAPDLAQIESELKGQLAEFERALKHEPRRPAEPRREEQAQGLLAGLMSVNR